MQISPALHDCPPFSEMHILVRRKSSEATSTLSQGSWLAKDECDLSVVRSQVVGEASGNSSWMAAAVVGVVVAVMSRDFLLRRQSRARGQLVCTVASWHSEDSGVSCTRCSRRVPLTTAGAARVPLLPCDVDQTAGA